MKPSGELVDARHGVLVTVERYILLPSSAVVVVGVCLIRVSEGAGSLTYVSIRRVVGSLY